MEGGRKIFPGWFNHVSYYTVCAQAYITHHSCISTKPIPFHRGLSVSSLMNIKENRLFSTFSQIHVHTLNADHYYQNAGGNNTAWPALAHLTSFHSLLSNSTSHTLVHETTIDPLLERLQKWSLCLTSELTKGPMGTFNIPPILACEGRVPADYRHQAR